MVIMKAEIKVQEEKLHGIKRQEEATVQTGQDRESEDPSLRISSMSLAKPLQRRLSFRTWGMEWIIGLLWDTPRFTLWVPCKWLTLIIGLPLQRHRIKKNRWRMKRDLEDTYICHFIQFHQFVHNLPPHRSLRTHSLGRRIITADTDNEQSLHLHLR